MHENKIGSLIGFERIFKIKLYIFLFSVDELFAEGFTI